MMVLETLLSVYAAGQGVVGSVSSAAHPVASSATSSRSAALSSTVSDPRGSVGAGFDRAHLRVRAARTPSRGPEPRAAVAVELPVSR